jgi:hypothetical protein
MQLNLLAVIKVLSALVLIARGEGAFITENYQLMFGWKRKTKEKAKHVITKMVELMDENEKQANNS